MGNRGGITCSISISSACITCSRNGCAGTVDSSDAGEESNAHRDRRERSDPHVATVSEDWEAAMSEFAVVEMTLSVKLDGIVDVKVSDRT